MAKSTSSGSLDKWREYFRGSNSDIFDIIEKAIMVAASDCSYEFKLKRDRIAEMLFACKITKCFRCDGLELAVPNDDDDDLEKSEDKYRSGIETGGSKDTKASKVSSNNDDDDGGYHRDVMEMNVHQVRDDDYGDAEALNDEIEEESQFFGEVLRIKKILDNYEEESDALLFDSLRRLQLIPLSVETLKATEIGKSVNALRKHGSKEIRKLVVTLIEDWKIMVDSWFDATKAITEIGTESVKTSVVEEEEDGLPSPPLDEGVFFATPTSMELSQFFDGMDDDDGNPPNFVEPNNNRENKTNVERTDTRKSKIESRPLPKVEHNRNPEAILKEEARPNSARPLGGERCPGLAKPSNYESGPGRPKASIKPKEANNQVQQKPDKGAVQRKPMPPQKEKLNYNDEDSVRMKLEAAKRKLHERYQEAENAKKQRTIQVVELRDLPKQSVVQRSQHGNHNRNRPNGRR